MRAQVLVDRLEKRVERILGLGLDEDDRMPARRPDDDDLGTERGRDIGDPVESLLAQLVRDRGGEPVAEGGDAREHLVGLLPLVGASGRS